MQLQIERKDKLQHTARLNRLVFGVALLWLATSVLLLVLAATGPNRKYEPKNGHTRTNAHRQLFARVEYQAAARASFIY